jgi:hypothetical protein
LNAHLIQYGLKQGDVLSGGNGNAYDVNLLGENIDALKKTMKVLSDARWYRRELREQ